MKSKKDSKKKSPNQLSTKLLNEFVGEEIDIRKILKSQDKLPGNTYSQINPNLFEKGLLSKLDQQIIESKKPISPNTDIDNLLKYYRRNSINVKERERLLKNLAEEEEEIKQMLKGKDHSIQFNPDLLEKGLLSKLEKKIISSGEISPVKSKPPKIITDLSRSNTLSKPSTPRTPSKPRTPRTPRTPSTPGTPYRLHSGDLVASPLVITRTGSVSSSRQSSILNLSETIVKNQGALDDLIKAFQSKYKFNKYIDIVSMEENEEFKQFLNMAIFYYNQNEISNILQKKISKKLKSIDKNEMEMIDNTYGKDNTKSSTIYFIVNYIFYTLSLIIKNLYEGFNDIDKLYKKKLKGEKLKEALFFNKTDRYNALSNYAHVLLYMAFYNTEFMPIKLQKIFKRLFNINRKGDKFIQNCNNILMNIKDKSISICNYPDKPNTVFIANSNGIKKLFNIITEELVVNESLELSRKFS